MTYYNTKGGVLSFCSEHKLAGHQEHSATALCRGLQHLNRACGSILVLVEVPKRRQGMSNGEGPAFISACSGVSEANERRYGLLH